MWWGTTLLPVLAYGGTLPDGEFDIRNSWIQGPKTFFEDFDRLEKRKYFYPKGVGYLNSEAVHFKVLSEDDGFPEISRLASMCKDARNQNDYVVHHLMKSHEWRVDAEAEAYFSFVPTFAGPVLDGECGPNAEAELTSLMRGLWRRPDFTSLHGHDLIMYASSESVHERHLARTRKIAQEHIPYDFSDMEKGDVSLIDYMLSQMTSLENFYRPTLQFCQLFFPVVLPEDVAVRNLTSDQLEVEETPVPDVFVWEEYVKNRPIEIAMFETIKSDDPRYAVRKSAYDALVANKNLHVQVVASQQSDVSGSQCDWNSTKNAVDRSVKCVLSHSVSDIEESRYRQYLFSRARYALITRGATPHPQSIYDAVKTGTLILNTIDKNLDMALPFQCQVPWEDFTIRIPSHAFEANPVEAIDEAIKSLTTSNLTKKLKLLKYYRPDILVRPGFGQGSRIVENTLLNALRRCSDEQLLGPRNMSRWDVKCPHMDYAKPSLLKRTVHNVDMPPWANF